MCVCVCVCVYIYLRQSIKFSLYLLIDIFKFPRIPQLLYIKAQYNLCISKCDYNLFIKGETR